MRIDLNYQFLAVRWRLYHLIALSSRISQSDGTIVNLVMYELQLPEINLPWNHSNEWYIFSINFMNSQQNQLLKITTKSKYSSIFPRITIFLRKCFFNRTHIGPIWKGTGWMYAFDSFATSSGLKKELEYFSLWPHFKNYSQVRRFNWAGFCGNLDGGGISKGIIVRKQY